MPAIPIGLVEDHPDLRDRLLQQLAFFDEVEVILSAESGDAFRADLAVRARSGAPLPAVVLMDIEVPGADGIATTRALRGEHPDIEVVMLTVFEDETRIFAAVQAGASGYLLKDAGPEAVVRAVQEVAAGGAPASPLVARKLLGYVRESAPADADAFDLTPREREVLTLLVEDDTEAQIADALSLSPHTVRSHIKNLYAKLEVHSRAAAVRTAFQSGIVR